VANEMLGGPRHKRLPSCSIL